MMTLVDNGQHYPQIYPAQMYPAQIHPAHQLSVLVESVILMICALEVALSLVLAVVQFYPFGLRSHSWVILGHSLTTRMSLYKIQKTLWQPLQVWLSIRWYISIMYQANFCQAPDNEASYTHTVIETSLSEPHTSMTALACMYACLGQPLTVFSNKNCVSMHKITSA